MFKVVNLETGECKTVYGINGSMFMMYDKENGWFYDDMNKYQPYIPQDEQNWLIGGITRGGK